MPTSHDEEVKRLKKERENLLSEDEVMWDEVNAIERELKFLGEKLEQSAD